MLSKSCWRAAQIRSKHSDKKNCLLELSDCVRTRLFLSWLCLWKIIYETRNVKEQLVLQKGTGSVLQILQSCSFLGKTFHSLRANSGETCYEQVHGKIFFPNGGKDMHRTRSVLTRNLSPESSDFVPATLIPGGLCLLRTIYDARIVKGKLFFPKVTASVLRILRKGDSKCSTDFRHNVVFSARFTTASTKTWARLVINKCMVRFPFQKLMKTCRDQVETFWNENQFAVINSLCSHKVILSLILSLKNYLRRTYGEGALNLAESYSKCFANFRNHVVFSARLSTACTQTWAILVIYNCMVRFSFQKLTKTCTGQVERFCEEKVVCWSQVTLFLQCY